jgi:hypothetical protein
MTRRFSSADVLPQATTCNLYSLRSPALNFLPVPDFNSQFTERIPATLS